MNDRERPVSSENPTQPTALAEREAGVVAIREGLADAEAGRVKPAREALKMLAEKYGLPDQ